MNDKASEPAKSQEWTRVVVFMPEEIASLVSGQFFEFRQEQAVQFIPREPMRPGMIEEEYRFQNADEALEFVKDAERKLSECMDCATEKEFGIVLETGGRVGSRPRPLP